MLNLKIGSGQKNTVLAGLKALFRSVGGKNNQELRVVYLGLEDLEEGMPTTPGNYIMDGNEIFAGPYRRASDAKGQLTRIKNGYTAGARRPNKEA